MDHSVFAIVVLGRYPCIVAYPIFAGAPFSIACSGGTSATSTTAAEFASNVQSPVVG